MARTERPTVCVAGGGTAGVEGLLALRRQLGPEPRLILIAPEFQFRYRPIDAGAPLRPARERGLPLADVAADAQARWLPDRVAAVQEGERRLITRDGEVVTFDALLVAAGARPRRALRQGEVWQRGRDPGFLDETVAGIRDGAVRSVAVVVPRGARWPIPAYELALVLGWTAQEAGAHATLITVEDRPLEALGELASQLVSAELAAAGVALRCGVEALDPPADDGPPPPSPTVLLTATGRAAADALVGRPTAPERVRPDIADVARFDRLIALPTMVGPSLLGIATDVNDFIAADASLQVCGSERIWAAGGCLAVGLEHSALSARQADVAAEGIAAALAATFDDVAAGPPPVAPELTGVLLRRQRSAWLAANPPGTRQLSTRCLWWPPGRAVGQMLARRIAAWDPSLEEMLPARPDGLFIRCPVVLAPHQPVTVPAADITPEVRAARLRDIEHRQLQAVSRHEREAEAELRALRTRLQTLTAEQEEVIAHLRRQGYLGTDGRPPPAGGSLPLSGRTA